jgi:hypothetical protein
MIASFAWGRCPAWRGEKRIDSDAQLDKSFDTQSRKHGERCGVCRLLAHPGRDQGECPVGLHHNQMVLAGKALAVHNLHHLLGPRMERIEDPHLERRTPGIVTLSRPAPAKPIWQLPLPAAAFEPAPAAASTTSSTL